MHFAPDYKLVSQLLSCTYRIQIYMRSKPKSQIMEIYVTDKKGIDIHVSIL